MIDPVKLFWLILRATLFSTSGSGNIPILYHDLRPLEYATERQFAEALAIDSGRNLADRPGFCHLFVAYPTASFHNDATN